MALARILAGHFTGDVGFGECSADTVLTEGTPLLGPCARDIGDFAGPWAVGPPTSEGSLGREYQE